jgi:threonine dehydratase
MADGIAVPMPGTVPFGQVQATVESVHTVSEEALSRALLLCLERAKLLVEPAGAAAVAALMTGAVTADGPVCAVLSGGNIDPLVLTHVMNHGLRAAGRYLVIRAVIPDRPGGLSGLLSVVGAAGASVLDVVHRRTAPTLALDEVEVMLTVETRGSAHREAVLDELARAGVRVTVEDGVS